MAAAIAATLTRGETAEPADSSSEAVLVVEAVELEALVAEEVAEALAVPELDEATLLDEEERAMGMVAKTWAMTRATTRRKKVILISALTCVF